MQQKLGVILAAGEGSRLRPATAAVNKQLLPVFDKPQVYYSISTLLLAGVSRIRIICKPEHHSHYKELLSRAGDFGADITFSYQDTSNGIVGALLKLDGDFLKSPLVVALGDNLFHGASLGENLATIDQSKIATALAHRVSEPSKFGIVELDEKGDINSLEEKPPKPKSNLALVGLYFLDDSWYTRAKQVRVSPRGELEIMPLLKSYHAENRLAVHSLPRGTAWFDLGEPSSLLDAGLYIRTIQEQQGLLVGSPEEAAVRQGLLGLEDALERTVKEKSDYFALLRRTLEFMKQEGLRR